MRAKTINMRRGAFGQPSVPFLLSRRGGGIACGNRALCEADAASAEALWTMPQLCGAAVIVHAVGYMFCFIIKTVVSVLETTRRLPAKICHRQFYRSYGYRFSCDTHFLFCEKETKTRTRTKGR